MYVWVSGEFLSKLSSLFSVCIAAVFQEEAKSIYLRVRLPLLVDLTPYSVLLFNHSVVSDSLRPRGPWIAALQASLSITNSQSLLTLTSTESVMPSNHLTLCRPLILLPSVFPASGSFPTSQFLASGGQSIGASASVSVLPMNIQGWFPLGWTGWISLQSKGLSRVFSNTTVQKHQFFGAQLSL